VTCGIACVLLIVLWVRSYTWRDQVGRSFTDARIYCVASDEGKLRVSSTKMYASGMEARWIVSAVAMPGTLDAALFDSRWGATQFSPAVPYWFPVLVTGMLAAAPWLPIKRF